MKKIINGKTYNTETATRIAHWWNGHSRSDFNFCEEELFQTPKGAWFVAGDGGARSRWSESYAGCSRGGEGIEVLTEAEALAWCESHDIEADIIEANSKIEEG